MTVLSLDVVDWWSSQQLQVTKDDWDGKRL